MRKFSIQCRFDSNSERWLHNAFENAAATASGALGAFEALMKKGQMKKKHINMIVFGGDDRFSSQDTVKRSRATPD